MANFLMVLLLLIALFLIVLVLIQRGKGGGLAGAFGGMGGQSAFGTKAGDLFTRITIGVAAVWIILCMFTVKYLGGGASVLDSMGSGVEAGAPVEPGQAPAGQTPAGQTPAGQANGDKASIPAPASAPVSDSAPAAPASGEGGGGEGGNAKP
jgi:preprotein translocase subunit SecG